MYIIFTSSAHIYGNIMGQRTTLYFIIFNLYKGFEPVHKDIEIFIEIYSYSK